MGDSQDDWVIMMDEDTGEWRRCNLGTMTPLDIKDSNWATGVELIQVYLMAGGKRVILETHSIWVDERRHRTIGTRYWEASPEEVALLAQRTGNNQLLMLVPVAE